MERSNSLEFYGEPGNTVVAIAARIFDDAGVELDEYVEANILWRAKQEWDRGGGQLEEIAERIAFEKLREIEVRRDVHAAVVDGGLPVFDSFAAARAVHPQAVVVDGKVYPFLGAQHSDTEPVGRLAA